MPLSSKIKNPMAGKIFPCATLQKQAENNSKVYKIGVL